VTSLPGSPPGEPYGQVLGLMAERSAAAATLVGDPFSGLKATIVALLETANDVPALLAAARKVLEVAAEFDSEDGHVPQAAGLRQPASRGDRVRRAFLAGLGGEDGMAALILGPAGPYGD
jgi:hypothetical protein